MTNEKRIEIEQDIVKRYIKAAEDAGYTAAKMNTGDEAEDYDASRLFESDECFIIFTHPEKINTTMYFVYGNEPGEVLNDYGVSLEPAIAEVNQYAEQWC
jgi:hypothetical protein